MSSDAYLSFPIEGVGLDAHLVAWLAENKDPELWHLLACYMMCETTDQLDILLWIVQQPDCDKSTAAAALIKTEVDRYIYTPSDVMQSPYTERYERLATVVCHNAADGFYTQLNIADPSLGIDRSTQGALADIEAGCAREAEAGRAPRLPVPDSLLSWDYPDTSFVIRYAVEQDAVIRLDAFDDFVRQGFPHRWPIT